MMMWIIRSITILTIAHTCVSASEKRKHESQEEQQKSLSDSLTGSTKRVKLTPTIESASASTKPPVPLFSCPSSASSSSAAASASVFSSASTPATASSSVSSAISLPQEKESLLKRFFTSYKEDGQLNPPQLFSEEECKFLSTHMTVQPNKSKALFFISQYAASLYNVSWAHYNLGACYAQGRGTVRNDHLALHHYTIAAKNNHAAAKEGVIQIQSIFSKKAPAALLQRGKALSVSEATQRHYAQEYIRLELNHKKLQQKSQVLELHNKHVQDVNQQLQSQCLRLQQEGTALLEKYHFLERHDHHSQASYQQLHEQYSVLQQKYVELQAKYVELQEKYSDNFDGFQDLGEEHEDLKDKYQKLKKKYKYLTQKDYETCDSEEESDAPKPTISAPSGAGSGASSSTTTEPQKPS